MNTGKMRPILAIALITAVCLFGDSMLYVTLPTHWKEVGLTSLVEVGALLSINRFVRLPLNPLIGYLYRKISPQKGILLAVVLTSITTTGYGLAKGFWTWMVLRAVWGLAWSFFKLGAYLLIIDVSNDQNRGHIMGKYNGLYRLGSLVGMLAGGFLVDHYGIRTIALIFAAFAIAAIPFVIVYLPSSKGVKQETNETPTKQSLALWMNRNVFWVLASGFLASMALEGMLTATLSNVIQIRYPQGALMIGGTVGAASIAGILQAIRWFSGPWISPWIGRISDGPTGRKRSLAITLLCASLLLAIIPIEMPLALWLPLLLAVLLVSSLLSTLSDSLASDVASNVYKIAIMTTYTIALDVGAALGPSVGYTVERFFNASVMYWASAVILFALGIRWFLGCKEDRTRIFVQREQVMRES